jgi:hypothetical protein
MTGTLHHKRRICGTCERGEHNNSKDGKCHYCWGSGIRSGEMVEGEPCHYCVFIYPLPPQFCDHARQIMACEDCRKEMMACGGDTNKITQVFHKHAMWRIDMKNKNSRRWSKCKMCNNELKHWAQIETGYCSLEHLQEGKN